jgi:HK97 family phage major capsid protein/HK97 family phage prohead protease
MDRAYSLLSIKSVNDAERVIEGIASTPTPDRMGDIVEPMGATFSVPMPLLWQHDADQPIGAVEFAKPTKDGIPFRARLVDPADVESATLKDRLQLAWDSIKTNLVRAVSIGFRAIKYSFMDDGGIRFLEWEWLELSAVTIPANADATINTIRSIDTTLRAASGREQPGVERKPAIVGKAAAGKTTVESNREKGKPMKTIAEQIAAFEEAKRLKLERRDEIQSKAAEEGRTKDAAEREEFETLRDEIKAIEAEIADLQDMQAIKAVPAKGAGEAEGSTTRGGGSIEVKNTNVPKGTAFTRYAIALARSRGNLMQALEIARNERSWTEQTPQVENVLRAAAANGGLEPIVRTAIAAGTTSDSTWAGPLVQYNVMASEFIELLRPATVIGKFGQNGVPDLRRVPFNIKVPRQTAGSSVSWVGEGKPKPVSKLAFDNVTLQWAKAAGIVVLTDELVRFSNPSAEALVQNDLISAMAQFLDQQFTDPDIAAVAGVSPASITNGVASVTASGTTADDFRADALSLMNNFRTSNISLAGAVWIMPETQAGGLAMLVNALGQAEFPGLTPTGGTLLGLPVITSQNDGLTDGGSPTGSRIILVKASDIMLADDGQVLLDASREASIQMNSAPDDPVSASTVLVSMFQENMVALRAERWINWTTRHTGAVQWITNADYGS